MLGAQFQVRTFSGFKTLKTADQGDYPTCRLISTHKNPPPSPSCSFQFSIKRIWCRFQCPRSITISCKASSDSSGSTNAHNNNGLEYLPASLLISGEFAIEKLIEGMQGDDNAQVCADQFQLVGNVKMVRITERVANTYFARLCF
ncbi:hypothetical protein OIU78_020659, partial [Salix suchowensis]